MLCSIDKYIINDIIKLCPLTFASKLKITGDFLMTLNGRSVLFGVFIALVIFFLLTLALRGCNKEKTPEQVVATKPAQPTDLKKDDLIIELLKKNTELQNKVNVASESQAQPFSRRPMLVCAEQAIRKIDSLLIPPAPPSVPREPQMTTEELLESLDWIDQKIQQWEQSRAVCKRVMREAALHDNPISTAEGRIARADAMRCERAIEGLRKKRSQTVSALEN